MAQHPATKPNDEDPEKGKADAKPDASATAAAAMQQDPGPEKEQEELVIRSAVQGTKMNNKIARLVEAHARNLGETTGVTVMAIGPTSVVYHGDKIGARKVSTE